MSRELSGDLNKHGRKEGGRKIRKKETKEGGKKEEGKRKDVEEGREQTFFKNKKGKFPLLSLTQLTVGGSAHCRVPEVFTDQGFIRPLGNCVFLHNFLFNARTRGVSG